MDHAIAQVWQAEHIFCRVLRRQDGVLKAALNVLRRTVNHANLLKIDCFTSDVDDFAQIPVHIPVAMLQWRELWVLINQTAELLVKDLTTFKFLFTCDDIDNLLNVFLIHRRVEPESDSGVRLDPLDVLEGTRPHVDVLLLKKRAFSFV